MVSDGNGGTATATVSITVNNNYKILLKADPAAIIGNGKDQTLLTATVTDKDGKPVEGVNVVFSSSNYNTTDNFINGYEKKNRY